MTTLEDIHINVTDVIFYSLDQLLENDFDVDPDADTYKNFVYLQEGTYMGADPISIDLLMTTLQDAKNLGANYIAIDFNTDNLEYDIAAYHAEPSTDEQIKKHLEDYNAMYAVSKKEEFDYHKKELEKLDEIAIPNTDFTESTRKYINEHPECLSLEKDLIEYNKINNTNYEITYNGIYFWVRYTDEPETSHDYITKLIAKNNFKENNFYGFKNWGHLLFPNTIQNENTTRNT